MDYLTELTNSPAAIVITAVVVLILLYNLVQRVSKRIKGLVTGSADVIAIVLIVSALFAIFGFMGWT